MRILVSACLLGLRCRYDGKSRECPEVLRLAKAHQMIPVCPEQLGGLSTPRPPAEIREGRVITREGKDVTDAYRRGAEEALRAYATLGCEYAILKADSPSCGCGRIHDGSFTGQTVPGSGVTARLLTENGVRVLTEQDLPPAGGLPLD